MKKRKTNSKQTNSLRKQAEKLLSEKAKAIPKSFTNDSKKMIHELQVHQIELEIQNEELRRAQAEIEESRNKYVDLYDFAPVGYFTLDQKGIILEANLTGAELLGVPRHLLLKKPFLTFAVSEYRNLFHSYFRKVLTTGSKQKCELKLVKKDGTQFHASMKGVATQDDEGNVAQCRIVIIDITERKRMEEELKALNESLEQRVSERTEELARTNEELRMSESKYRLLLENLPLRIFYKDRNLVYVSCNENYARDLYIKPDEIKGKTDYDFYPRALAEKYRAEDMAIIKLGQAKDMEDRFTVDGKEYIFQVIKTPVKDQKNDISGILCISWDITEKVNLQQEVMRAAHLAALGELAAGVAHEINNPITGIINCAQLLFNRSKEGSDEKDLTSRIIKEGDRIATITNSLLSFARQGEKVDKKGHVHIKKIVSNALVLTETQLKKEGIKLIVNIPPELPEIVASPHQIEQVFLNIISNARYALNQKYPATNGNKILEIIGEEITTDDSPYVKVTFCDRGTGIPANIRDKVWIPFFTTKPRGIGTGLGLSVSHSIVKEHGGKLMIDSIEGEFTRIAVVLPVAKMM